jgi:hypothetical protein
VIAPMNDCGSEQSRNVNLCRFPEMLRRRPNLLGRLELDLKGQCPITSEIRALTAARNQTKRLPRIKLTFALELGLMPWTTATMN